MTHALVTIIAPLKLDRLRAAEDRIDALGNPAREGLQAELDRLEGSDGTHFCSLNAIASKDLGKAYLAFELSADGTAGEAIGRIARAIGPQLATVFALASDWRDGGDIGAYLVAHQISIGVGLFDSPGLAFAGTPGMSVGRILAEQKLASHAAAALAKQAGDMWAMQRVDAVRKVLASCPAVSDMLETGTATPPYAPLGIAGLIGTLVSSFLATYLWPIGLLVAALALVGGVWNGSIAWAADGAGAAFMAFLWAGVRWLLFWGLVALVAVVIGLVVAYSELRSLEVRDSLEERTPDSKTLHAIFERENHYVQNHMLSVTQRKPGFIRWFTARLVFWVIGQLATNSYEPGFLSDIGTIHFARWVTVPGTRDLLFFSNFDNSWESYLEDFITKAHAGLTGVWSNSIGFPRTENLFQKGATDGERFKRYARQSMIPTRFWYCAYPKLTTTNIRTNAAIRLGLSGALTEDEATSWLALFGSAARPPTKLINSEIQSLILGGLGFLKSGVCLFYDLPETVLPARNWLGAVTPHISFDDARRLKEGVTDAPAAVATLALGAPGLKRLGLPDEGLETFPYAFLQGLTNDARRRILGDTGENASKLWRWGQVAPHAALLVYGKTDADVDKLESVLAGFAKTYGAALTHRVPLKRISHDKREPFGFTDGISQPIIRGTYKGLKAADPIHLVEPGEFILGYPDNRGNTPPGPTLPATADPRNILPLVDVTGDFTRNFVDGVRDLGCNGSFLVIRELEQDVGLFRNYCQEQATMLKDRLRDPYDVTAEFIAAKLVGRWQNGSSMVRHPYRPKKDHHKAEAPAHCQAGANAPATPQSGPATGTERPTAPAQAPGATPVQPPMKASHLEDNDFLFGTEDPEALACPFGAHIRRANPRDSLSPGSQDQIDISNRHRIIRIGRQYVPEDPDKPGLFFMCLNGDLERQFEFVQQTWLNTPFFQGLAGEQDPLLGDGEEGMSGFTIPSRYGPLQLKPVPQMVATRGGGYFFIPGKRLLDFLAVPP